MHWLEPQGDVAQANTLEPDWLRTIAIHIHVCTSKCTPFFYAQTSTNPDKRNSQRDLTMDGKMNITPNAWRDYAALRQKDIDGAARALGFTPYVGGPHVYKTPPSMLPPRPVG